MRKAEISGSGTASIAEGHCPIAALGVIGDRRTAAVIGPDGTVLWLCLPDYDSTPVFGHLLDCERGGYWRLGPACSAGGKSRYLMDTNVLSTSWQSGSKHLELTDTMLLPEHTGPGRNAQAILLRRLRCLRGTVSCTMRLAPRADFAADPAISPVPGGFAVKIGELSLALWCSRSVEAASVDVSANFSLAAGEEFWAVLELAGEPRGWDTRAAAESLQSTIEHWQEWRRRYSYRGPREEQIVRSALAIELLSFAPTGAIAAAATCSLPERIGGDRNYDYRYAWIRDASMAIATLSVLGDLESAERYLAWLAGLGSSTEMPLQVLYRVTGATDIEQHAREELAGYCASRPVLFGNHAYRQRQIDCFGYLADCALIYLLQGGKWKPEYWRLIRRVADYTVENWRKPGNGIWERAEQRHYVSSKVMSWTTLKRALEFAERSGDSGDLRRWRAVMIEIHADVMENGWSERLQSFRQHYDADTLDASALLVPLMGFLEPTHPRVLATVERIEQELMLDGLVYRFQPEESAGPDALPMGSFEGAFLPCCFWLAAVYVMAGRREDAAAMLRRIDLLTGDTGLLSEEADSRTGLLLGNLPMVFSHAEHARAELQLAGAWPRDL